MRIRRNTVGGLFTITALAAVVLAGCRAFEPEVVIVNKAPETYIIGSPMEHGGGYFHFHVFWYGSDADGRVERFVWALTDTTVQDPLTTDDEEDQRFNPALDASTLEIGHWTSRTDSIFDFRIELGTNPSADMTLHMVAVDDFGDYDRTPARLHFFSNTLGTPVINFFRVEEDAGGNPINRVPIGIGQSDTIGFGKPYRVAWEGESPNILNYADSLLAKVDTVYPFDDGLFGFKWQLTGALGGTDGMPCVPTVEDCWHPRDFNVTTGDSFSYYGQATELRFANDVPGSDDPFEKLLPNGKVNLLVNSIDVAGVEVIDFRREFSFVVNRDPETVVLDSTSHGSDPQIYPYYTLLGDPTQTKYPFSNGARIPDRSYVVVKALGRDDDEDEALDPDYGVGIEGFVTGKIFQVNGGRFTVRTLTSPLNSDLGQPDPNGWYADTLGFLVGPRTTYTFNMTAVDEHGRVDGTPAQLKFHVGFEPCIQCVELKAKAFDTSDFPDPDLECYAGEGTSHPCMDGSTQLQITQDGSGASDLDFLRPAFFALERSTKYVTVLDDITGLEGTHYFTDARIYRMRVLFHAQDDPRERWSDPEWRTMAWRYQVDYECDPANQIKDGGGSDDIKRITQGIGSSGGMDIESEGLWSMEVEVAIPTRLLTRTPLEYYNSMFFDFDLDWDMVDAMYWGSIRQLGDGFVQAVALDQTNCAGLPLGRPAAYNYFKNVRNEITVPPNGMNWRDCNLDAQGALVPNLARKVDLGPSTMESLAPKTDADWWNDPDANPWVYRNGTTVRGVPAIKDFRIVLLGPAGEVDCHTPPE